MKRPTLLTLGTAILLLWSTAAVGAMPPPDVDLPLSFPATRPAPASHDNDTDNGTGNRTYLAPVVTPAETTASGPVNTTLTEAFTVENPDTVAQDFSYRLLLPIGWRGRVVENATPAYAPGETRTVHVEFTTSTPSRGEAVLVVSGRGGNDTGVARACFHGPNQTSCDPTASPQPPVVTPHAARVVVAVGQATSFNFTVENPSDLDQDVRVTAHAPLGWRVSLAPYDPHFAPGESRVLTGTLLAVLPGEGNVTLVARSADGMGQAMFLTCATLAPLEDCAGAATAATAAARPDMSMDVSVGVQRFGLAGQASVRILQ